MTAGVRADPAADPLRLPGSALDLRALRVSVIRSDMFGARVARQRGRQAGGRTPAAGRREGRQAPPRRADPASPSSRAPTGGETVSLDDAPLLIGRGTDAAIRLDDDYVSTRHARIAADQDQWYVEDLGSTNGTYVGTSRITQPTTLPLGHPGPDRQDDPGAAEVADGRPALGDPTTGATGRLRLRYTALSDVGRVRKDNQDSGYAGEHLLAIADGVGGLGPRRRRQQRRDRRAPRTRRTPGQRPAGRAGRGDPAVAPSRSRPWSSSTPSSTARAPR